MIRQILGFILLTPAALAQIRPDVSYTGANDRFDLTAVVRAQSKMMGNNPLIDDGASESDGDYRRHMGNDDTEKLLKTFRTRREEIDFAYDPDNLPTIGRGGDDSMVDLEYKENLKNFVMNIPKGSRRKAQTDDQKREDAVLMENVVPIVLEIDGYLKTPLHELVSLHAKQGKRVIFKVD